MCFWQTRFFVGFLFSDRVAPSEYWATVPTVISADALEGCFGFNDIESAYFIGHP